MPGGLTVGEVAVELDARTRQFSARMSDAERRILRFEHQSERSTRAAALSFRNLLGPIVAIGGALAALGVTRGLIRIAKSAIDSAAAFEGYEIRLKALLGSQQSANKALESFLSLSTRTPFALSQIVSGAATLASVARGSRSELEDLTEVTANLAAVTGLNFQEAAGNLQRALSAGIGAADLFRDRGVRKLIEDINQVPDLTKVSLQELRRLFKETFAPGSLSGFGNAARDLSMTLGGALSNIGDAMERFRIALGKALSPAVIATAKGVIIPFFDTLTGKVEANQNVLARFFVEAFARGAEAIGKVIRAVDPLITAVAHGITRSLELANEIHELFIGLVVTFDRLRLGVSVLETGLNAVGAALRVISFTLGLRTREEVEEQMDALDESVSKTVKLAFDIHDQVRAEAEKNKPALEEHQKYFEGLALKAEGAAEAIRKIGAEQLALAAARAGATDEIPTTVGAAADVDRAALKARAQLRANLDAVAEAETRFAALIAQGFVIPDEQLERMALVFGDRLSMGFIDSLDALLGGEAVDWAEQFSAITSDLFRESMTSVLDDLAAYASDAFKDVGQGFGNALSGIFGGAGGEGGGWNIGAAFGAAVGIGGRILSGALRGTESDVRNELVQSAVTSTQALRGVVAGPANIPIAQVGDAIRDAFAGQLTELRRSNTLLGAILQAIRGLDVSAYPTSDALADVIAAEFNASVAMG